MDAHTSVLLRYDSWTRPGLKATEILRTVSLEDAKDNMLERGAIEEGETRPDEVETRAVLSTTAKKEPSSELSKPKTVVKIDVHCTPGSSFEDIIKQLENPCLPTFKLTDLPADAKDDLHRFASPGDPRGAFGESKPRTLEAELALFPAGATLTENSIAPGLPSSGEMQCDSGLSYPASASMEALLDPLEQELAPRSSTNLHIGGVPDISSDRPMKRAKLVELDDRHGADSGSDTGSAGGAGRGRRLACLRCGTHQTPQWRMGPEGPRTMCNACGVKYKKELKEREKREREVRSRHHGLPAQTEAAALHR